MEALGGKSLGVGSGDTGHCGHGFHCHTDFSSPASDFPLPCSYEDACDDI